jgi:hypothetical protein
MRSKASWLAVRDGEWMRLVSEANTVLEMAEIIDADSAGSALSGHRLG